MERRFRNAEHIKLMKKVHEIFRKMRLSGNFHEHLQLVPVFRKDAADDNLLAQRRKSILHRGAELIKNAVGKTRKPQTVASIKPWPGKISASIRSAVYVS